MFINSGNEKSNIYLNINGMDLETANGFEYLGMHIDNQ